MRIRFPEIVLTVWLSHKKNFVHDIFCPKDVWWIGSIPYEHVPDILSTHHFIVREHNRNLKCQKKTKTNPGTFLVVSVLSFGAAFDSGA